MNRQEKALVAWGATHVVDCAIRSQGVKYRWAWWHIELVKLAAAFVIMRVVEAA